MCVDLLTNDGGWADMRPGIWKCCTRRWTLTPTPRRLTTITTFPNPWLTYMSCTLVSSASIAESRTQSKKQSSQSVVIVGSSSTGYVDDFRGTAKRNSPANEVISRIINHKIGKSGYHLL